MPPPPPSNKGRLARRGTQDRQMEWSISMEELKQLAEGRPDEYLTRRMSAAAAAAAASAAAKRSLDDHEDPPEKVSRLVRGVSAPTMVLRPKPSVEESTSPLARAMSAPQLTANLYMTDRVVEELLLLSTPAAAAAMSELSRTISRVRPDETVPLEPEEFDRWLQDRGSRKARALLKQRYAMLIPKERRAAEAGRRASISERPEAVDKLKQKVVISLTAETNIRSRKSIDPSIQLGTSLNLFGAGGRAMQLANAAGVIPSPRIIRSRAYARSTALDDHWKEMTRRLDGCGTLILMIDEFFVFANNSGLAETKLRDSAILNLVVQAYDNAPFRTCWDTSRRQADIDSRGQAQNHEALRRLAEAWAAERFRLDNSTPPKPQKPVPSCMHHLSDLEIASKCIHNGRIQPARLWNEDPTSNGVSEFDCYGANRGPSLSTTFELGVGPTEKALDLARHLRRMLVDESAATEPEIAAKALLRRLLTDGRVILMPADQAVYSQVLLLQACWGQLHAGIRQPASQGVCALLQVVGPLLVNVRPTIGPFHLHAIILTKLIRNRYTTIMNDAYSFIFEGRTLYAVPKPSTLLLLTRVLYLAWLSKSGHSPRAEQLRVDPQQRFRSDWLHVAYLFEHVLPLTVTIDSISRASGAIGDYRQQRWDALLLLIAEGHYHYAQAIVTDILQELREQREQPAVDEYLLAQLRHTTEQEVERANGVCRQFCPKSGRVSAEIVRLRALLGVSQRNNPKSITNLTSGGQAAHAASHQTRTAHLIKRATTYIDNLLQKVGTEEIQVCDEPKLLRRNSSLSTTTGPPPKNSLPEARLAAAALAAVPVVIQRRWKPGKPLTLQFVKSIKYLMEMYEALLVDTSKDPDVWKVKQECWRLISKASKLTRQEAEEEVQKAMAERQIKKAEDVPELQTIDTCSGIDTYIMTVDESFPQIANDRKELWGYWMSAARVRADLARCRVKAMPDEEAARRQLVRLRMRARGQEIANPDEQLEEGDKPTGIYCTESCGVLMLPYGLEVGDQMQMGADAGLPDAGPQHRRCFSVTCSEPYDSRQQIVELSCGHRYHRNCCRASGKACKCAQKVVKDVMGVAANVQANLQRRIEALMGSDWQEDILKDGDDRGSDSDDETEEDGGDDEDTDQDDDTEIARELDEVDEEIIEGGCLDL